MKKAFKILLLFFLSLAGIILLFMVWVLAVPGDKPPRVNDLSETTEERNFRADSTVLFGNNWIRKSNSGLWEMYVEGKPFERGVAFGKLTKELLYFQEKAFVSQIRELVPSEGYLKFLKHFTAWFNRALDKNIIDEYRQEIYGTSFACSPEFDFIGTGYQRQLNYHAAHDIGHALQGMMMVGCTSFSVWGSKSSDSSLLVARNFDFYAGDDFARNKIVCFYNPSSGHRFMMITWADMTGVVSGMNVKGLTVTINAARSSVPFKAYTPVSLVAREILQYASNIKEADSIARLRRMFVSESILIGSASDGRSAIIEKSPGRHGLFSPSGNMIICANHFQGETFRNDPANIANIEGSDSRIRFGRASELLGAVSTVDVTNAASILRDMKTPGGREAGLGNPAAINQLIAHHSVIFKPAELIAWVSTSPWQAGRYVAYDLNKVFSADTGFINSGREICETGLEIPADSFIYSDRYNDYLRYRKMSASLRKMSGEMELPEGFEDEFIKTNPENYTVYSSLAGYWYERGDYEKALTYYREALGKELPGNDIRKDLEEMSEKAYLKSEHADRN